MTEKTLKIRIKMHSPTDSPESTTTGSEEIKANTDSTRLFNGGDKLHMGVVALISGVVMLTIALIFLNLRDREEPQLRTDLNQTNSDLVTESQSDGDLSDDKLALSSVLEQESGNTRGLDTDPAQPSTDAEQTTEGYEPTTRGESAGTLKMPASPQPVDDTSQAHSSPAEAEADSSINLVDQSQFNQPGEGGSRTALNRPGTDPHPQSSRDLSNQHRLNKDTSAEPAATPAASTTQVESQSPRIARAQFTNGIQGREPIDRVESVVQSDGQTNQRLFYFTELRNLEGETITHRWEHEGQQVAEVSFNVRGNRWRVFSSKALPPNMTGEWQVVVTKSDGEPLTTASFVYQEP